MFNSKNKKSACINTIIGVNTTFEGIITTEEPLKVQGTVKGDIRSSGHVIIDSTGYVEGNINAENLYVAGKICGDVNVINKSQFVAGGYLNGNIVSNDITMEIGSSIDGKCKTNNSIDGFTNKSLPQNTSKELPKAEDNVVAEADTEKARKKD